MSSTFTVRLPADMKPALETEARAQGFKSVAAYLAHLARANGKGPIPYEDNPELEAMLLEGINSEPLVVDDAFWRNLRRDVKAAVRRRKSKKKRIA